jgi:glycosyltransferase involved in cell wall biosynthesis
LGTPENWNEAIRNASGEWIKLMHDDDWFNNEKSLEKFVEFTNIKKAEFFFSAYQNHLEGCDRVQKVYLNFFWHKALLDNPAILFSRNVVGPPSVTLIKNHYREWYDKRIKWVVDIDYYIRYFQQVKPVYIPQILINVGINSNQVTQSTFRVKEVEIPENFYLLNKVGRIQLRNILVYDAWWRLLRNLKMRSQSDIREAGYKGDIPPVIEYMLQWQGKLPNWAKKGVFSKFFMFLSFIRNFDRM